MAASARSRKSWPALSVAVTAVLLAGCGGSSSGEPRFTGSAYPGIDLGNRRAADTEIAASDIGQLRPSWTLPIEGRGTYGSYASTPVVAGGVVYSQDLESNVQAIDLESGEVLWSTKLESASHGPNGLAVADGRVYGTTADAAFALDQQSGEKLWYMPLGGAVDMAPGTNEGRVYVSTVPESKSSGYEAGAVGTLWALDTGTGKKLWRFDTVPKGLWGKPGVNSGGGLWYPPSFDGEGNLYAGIGNPAPVPGAPGEPWGSSRPGRNLYADSMVKLDAETGKLIWYYQQTPHNIYDWDFQDSPVLVKAGGRELAIGAGKSGVVVALDAKTGKPVWTRAVGEHNGHDNDPLYAMRGEYSKIKTGEVFPGQLGGVIAPMATDGKSVFVPVVNHSMTVVSGTEVSESSTAMGEVVAIDLRTGNVVWDTSFQSPAYGALLAVNDMVLATSADGVIHAYGAHSGGEKWHAALPAGTNAGVMASGDTLLAGAGLPVAEGQVPKLVAYRLPPVG